jgi:membrane fusion protein (multidrug efflux system)
MRPLLFVGLIILALVLGKIFFFTDKDEAAAGSATAGSTASSAMPVNYVVARYSSEDQSIFSTGTVVPNEEVELKSEVNGRLIDLSLQEGNYVKKGQRIAKLQDDELRAQLKKVAYEESLAAQIEARQKKLLDINAISKEEYEIAVNKTKTLSVDKELLEVQLRKTVITAPFNGKIGLKNISEGAYITPATVIGTLVQTNPVKIDFTIPEKYSQLIKRGQKITFQRDGSPQDYTATVIAIDPKVDENLRTLRIRSRATNNGGDLLPGMFVRVNLNLGTEQSIMIPTDAVVPILDGKKVYVMRNGKATDAMIKTGLRNERSVQVINGLQIGDSVITSGLITLKNGAAVRPRN